MRPVVVRGRDSRPIIMEVVNQEGKTVSEYNDSGDKRVPHQFVIERAELC